MVNRGPESGPKFHIQKFEPAENRPHSRAFFHARASWSQEPIASVFKSLVSTHMGSPSRIMSSFTLKALTFDMTLDDCAKWRSGDPVWEGIGPQPGDVNEVVRRRPIVKSTICCLPPQRGCQRQRPRRNGRQRPSACVSSSTSSTSSASSDSDAVAKGEADASV